MAEKKVKVEEQAIEPVRAKVDNKTIEDFLFTSGTKLDEKQKALFSQLSFRNNLDPFKREIYAITYKNKTTGKDDLNIVTGYQVYIQRAEMTGKLDGWHCESLKNVTGDLTGAKITIYRKDFQYPFEWEVSLKEFTKGQANWQTMPEFMIKKVCIGQGFRLAFPSEVGGLPYLQEEIEGLSGQDEINHEPKLIAHIDDGKVVADSKPEPKVAPLATTPIDETVKSKIDTPVVPANTKPPIGPIPHKVFSKSMSPKEYMIYLLEAVEKLNKEFYDNTVQALVDAYGDKFPDNLPEAEYSKILTQLKPYVKSK